MQLIIIIHINKYPSETTKLYQIKQAQESMLSCLLWFSTTKSTMGSLSGVSVTKMHNGRILFAPKFGNFLLGKFCLDISCQASFVLAQCININPEYCKNHLSINIQLSSLRHPLSRDFLSLVELATCREAASLRSPAKGLP